MSVTSIYFLAFCFVLLLIYYGVPGKARWYVLLTGSLLFYLISAAPVTIIYLLVSVGTVYWATIRFAVIDGRLADTENRDSGQCSRAEKEKRIWLTAVLTVNFGILAVLKYLNLFLQPVFFVYHLSGGLTETPYFRFTASLGISFYTLQITGYLLDCYWGKCQAERNIGKVLLFGCYFPQMVSGPISRYGELSQTLYAGARFQGIRVLHGIQRVLWGFFQKLVISERLAVIVNTVYGDPDTYSGFYVWAAAFAFILQLYTDFAGCMDIVLGTSECFGVVLPENFRQPFSARTIQEFWQRWHITLGTWLKDYIMYPVLKTETWYRMGSKIKKRWGKSLGKRIPTWAGLFVLWTAMGVWHGNDWKYVIGEGFWFWFLIVGSQMMEPVWKKGLAFFHINKDAWWWIIIQRIRTFFCFATGMIFFRADSLKQACYLLRNGVLRWNAGILGSGLFSLGLGKKELAVTAAGLLLLGAVSHVSRKREDGDVRDWLDERPLVARWAVWYGLFFSVLVLGCYGASYDTSNFIYAGF